ncbi:hypothetical protein [Streptomyces sp. PTY087I2]|uniref:hypothetical protein n=1 Tax=Streptomyces sp. PTY087I2 TaxID=1819298 RepID=UPI0021001BC9|nr:hypothetical protein [Streptomyces sp. PTY087I2]
MESNASATPFVTLSPATLDALDGRGELTYFAKISEGNPRHSPRGIVRRRVDDDQTHDEAFTRNLRWEPTEYLRLYDLGHNDIDHVRITEIEAAAFIESLTERLAGTSDKASRVAGPTTRLLTGVGAVLTKISDAMNGLKVQATARHRHWRTTSSGPPAAEGWAARHREKSRE